MTLHAVVPFWIQATTTTAAGEWLVGRMDIRPGRLWFEYLKSQYDRRYVCKGLKARQSKGELWPFIIYSSSNNRTKRNDRSRQDDAMQSNGIQSQFRGMTE